MRHYFDREPCQQSTPGHPKTTLPSVINKELLHSFKGTAADRAFKTQGDLDVLRTKAAFHPTTAIDDWKTVGDTVFDTTAASYKNRQTQSSIIRTSARTRDLLDKSPSAYVEMHKYRVTDTYKPANLITPPYQDFGRIRTQPNVAPNNYTPQEA